jgi:hypothetical protein
VATYAASCATKHSPRYGVLLVGRLLGGIATSLLFSVFEAWAVAAHAARGFDEPLLVRAVGEFWPWRPHMVEPHFNVHARSTT